MPTSAPSCVALIVNGEAITTAAATLADLLAARGLSDAKVATALNGAFISARERAAARLSPGDKIEIVSARQGG